MNNNYTHLVVLIDASGSMEQTKQATIDGINNFIESQKHLPEAIEERNLSFEEDLSDSNKQVKCTVTLASFSSQSRQRGSIAGLPFYNTIANGEPTEAYNYTILAKELDINQVPLLTNENYDTFGGTPLVDVFYKTIIDCSGFISRLTEDNRPGRVIIVSITDGEENASNKRTRAELKLLTEEKVKLNWQFIYLGANQDAFSESNSYGVQQGQAMNYAPTNQGVMYACSALSDNVLMKRTSNVDNMSLNCIADYDQTNNIDITTGTNVPLTYHQNLFNVDKNILNAVKYKNTI